MYREIAGTDERVRVIPGVRDRRVRATKVRLYVVGTQKNRLNETVLFEHPKHMLKVIGKKILTILC